VAISISVLVAGQQAPLMPANDNGDGAPAVRVPEGRPEGAYAHQGNLILPLQFARLMPGWQAGDGRPAVGHRQTPTPRRTMGAPGRRVRISDRRFARAR